MTIQELSSDERRVVVFAIRQFGQGGHAYPDEKNITFFTSDYARQCLGRVLKRAVLDARESERIRAIIDKLET